MTLRLRFPLAVVLLALSAGSALAQGGPRPLRVLFAAPEAREADAQRAARLLAPLLAEEGIALSFALLSEAASEAARHDVVLVYGSEPGPLGGRAAVVTLAPRADEGVPLESAAFRSVRDRLVQAAPAAARSAWSRLRLPEPRYRASAQIPNYERRNPPPRLQEPMSPRESMALTQVPPGFELRLFAAEPDIVKPIAMAWDARGRLWIAESMDYPNEVRAGQPGRDRIKILEDTNGDGRADRFTVFAEGLNIPTSLTFSEGGVIIAQAPELIFLKDTNGDDRADLKRVLVRGWGTRDTHAGPSNLRYGFDNWIWGAVGYSSFQGAVGGDSLRFGQAIWRMRPDGNQMEHVASFSNNTWGLGFSEEFDVFGSTANNTHAVYVGIPHRYTRGLRGFPSRAGSEKIDGHYAMSPITPNVRQVDVFGGFTAAAGFNLYTARAYPREYWNRIALVSEPTGRVLHRAILEPRGAGFTERDGWNLLASRDEWMGPVDAQVGPDGQVWVLDWYNFIIQHNPTPPGFDNGEGNAYVTPLRDRQRGRIYRIVHRDAPAYRPMDLSRAGPAQLVRALTHDNLFWRLTAQRLLVERGQVDVVPALLALVADTDTDAIGLDPGALHALWTLHGLGALDGSDPRATAAATAALRHPVAAVRRAAIQVLPETEATLREVRAAGLLEGGDPRVRLAALLLASRLPESPELGRELLRIGQAPEVQNDPWLAQALMAAAARHRPGYLGALAAELGDGPYRALAERMAREEAAPPAPRAPTEPGPPPPVAERVLRAYLEEVVGPIRRPVPSAPTGAAANQPVLSLTVSVVPGQLKFALPAFTAKAGQRVRLTLTNPDDMQHNLLVIRPGTTEAVGTLADAMAATPDGAERNYIPPTPDVLNATPLVDPGQSFTLEFTAPRTAGDYPYICTFPGHWRVMQGVMTVQE